MTAHNYVTFDVSPHRHVLRRGHILLEEINSSLDIQIFFNITPSYIDIQTRVLDIRILSIAYLKEIESVTGESTYKMELDSSEGGEYVSYPGMITIEDELKMMKKSFARILIISNKISRTTIYSVARSIKKHVRRILKINPLVLVR